MVRKWRGLVSGAPQGASAGPTRTPPLGPSALGRAPVVPAGRGSPLGPSVVPSGLQWCRPTRGSYLLKCCLGPVREQTASGPALAAAVSSTLPGAFGGSATSTWQQYGLRCAPQQHLPGMYHALHTTAPAHRTRYRTTHHSSRACLRAADSTPGVHDNVLSCLTPHRRLNCCSCCPC